MRMYYWKHIDLLVVKSELCLSTAVLVMTVTVTLGQAVP